MKKLITLATACLSLGALVACGKGGEAKTEWTEEEKALIAGDDGVLNFELPFYKAKLEVSADEENGLLLLTSGRKASAKDVEAYVALLDSEEYGYEEFDTQYGEPVGEDVLDFVDYADEFELRFKNVPSSSGGQSVTNDVVAVGLTEEGKLVIAATIFYNYMDLNGGYQPALLGATSEFEDWMSYFGYTVGSVPWPSAEAFPAATQVDAMELSLLYPFTYGNVYSSEFTIGYDLFVLGATEAEYNDFLTAVGEAVELTSSQGMNIGTIEGEDGTTLVAVGSYNAQYSGFEFLCQVRPAAQ